jgi:hypothetical protein
VGAITITNRSLHVDIAPFVRQQELWPGAGVHSARNLTYTWIVGLRLPGRAGGPQGRAIRAGQHAGIGLASFLWVGCLCVMASIEPCVECLAAGGRLPALHAACAYATYFAATYSPPTPTSPALNRPPGRCRCCYRSLLLPTPMSYPITSPPFRRPQDGQTPNWVRAGQRPSRFGGC